MIMIQSLPASFTVTWLNSFWFVPPLPDSMPGRFTIENAVSAGIEPDATEVMSVRHTFSTVRRVVPADIQIIANKFE